MPEDTADTPVKSLEDLKTRASNGRSSYAIALNGGAYSRKTIQRSGVSKWRVHNHIDETRQVLTDEELWTESNIGPAIDAGALWEIR